MEYTYQDYLEVLETNSETQLIQFVLNAIHEHKRSEKYEIAVIADEYFRHLNRTILDYQKLLYTVSGKVVPDNYSANYKLSSNFFFQFVTGLNQYLLSNGVSWGSPSTEKRVGKNFDKQLQYAGERALVGSVSFGFMNYDHLEVFGFTEFKPMYDEDNGALCAGIRFWQLSNQKPLHAILYDSDGYTHFVWKDGVGSIKEPKTPYKIAVKKTDVGGVEYYEGANYPTFPIVPFFGINKQSELVGNQEVIDAYDLMASALVNNVDDGNLIYWVLKNCGGMSPEDDAQFLEDLRSRHVAHADGDDGAGIEARSVEAPFQANEAALERLRSQLFDDFMEVDIKAIAGSSATATQIRAAYEPLNAKADRLEYQVSACINALLAFVGIDDAPTYTRSYIINQQESIQSLVTAGEYLPRRYVTRKILEIIGDSDAVDEVENLLADEALSTSKAGDPE